jgi:molybdenum cofactor cytidylyltransferase
MVTGAYDTQVKEAVNDLPVLIIDNLQWESGQASSIRTGLSALYARPEQLPGSVFFLLADQPQVSSEILHALSDEHARCLAPVLAPLVDGQRANPVLFDQMTFPDLMKLTGDIGGRGIFSKFSPTYLSWYDHSLLLDVDSPEDYKRLKEYWE